MRASMLAARTPSGKKLGLTSIDAISEKKRAGRRPALRKHLDLRRREHRGNWLRPDLRTKLLCCAPCDLQLNTETKQTRLFKHHIFHWQILITIGSSPLPGQA